jgi:predicted dehydrogenase
MGTAGIARKNWRAIALTGNGTVAAVASRDLARCRRFIGECQAAVPMRRVPDALGSYEALVASRDVDGIYIPLPTGLRKEWVLRAAAAGKHVVCEKPCAASIADLEEMLEACRRNGVQFMDGVMFMHSARLKRMREVLDDGESIGPIRRVSSAFTFRGGDGFFDRDIRAHGGLEPFGCLGDLGWYNIKYSLWAMDWKMPVRVAGRVSAAHRRADAPSAVPIDFAGELFFEGGATASFHCSFISEFQQWAVIGGEKGFLHVDDFVLPFGGTEVAFEVRGADFVPRPCGIGISPRARRVAVAEHGDGHETSQETRLFRDFAEQARSGTLNAFWHETALKTQQVMIACHESAARAEQGDRRDG